MENGVRMDLVYNPAAGRFRPAQLDALADALRSYGFLPRMIATTPEGVALSDDAELVCVHGGDGAVRLTVEALGQRVGKVPLCISPAGTINLVARELGYRSQPALLAAQIARAWARGRESWISSPVISFGGAPVVACASIGPDSATVAHLSSALKQRIGRYAYVVAMAQLVRRWPRHRMDLRAELADGTMLEIQAEAIFLARGRYYAGPFRLSKKAALDSETVELVIMPRAGRLHCTFFALAVMMGLPLDRLGIARTHSVRAVDIGESLLPIQVDGDSTPPRAGRLAAAGHVARYCI